MTSLPQHSQRETGTDARSRHAFPWGRRRNTAGNQDHVRTGDWETGTNLSSGEETNHKANSKAGCTNKGVELKAEEAIPAQCLGDCKASTGLVQGTGSSLSHHGINQVHAARQQIKPTGPASPGLYVSSHQQHQRKDTALWKASSLFHWCDGEEKAKGCAGLENCGAQDRQREEEDKDLADKYTSLKQSSPNKYTPLKQSSPKYYWKWGCKLTRDANGSKRRARHRRDLTAWDELLEAP